MSEGKFEVTEEYKKIQEEIKIQKIINEAPERTQEQIEIFGKEYQPSDGDMVELPGGLKGGIIIATPDENNLYEIELENGLKVKAPANKLLLCGCWTAHKRYLTNRKE